MSDYKLVKYMQQFLNAVRADVDHLVGVNFAVTDERIIDELYDAITIIKIAQKTLPLYVWKECASRRNGLISYRRMNAYLEGYMGTRQKTEMAMRRMTPAKEKRQTLRDYVEAPRMTKQPIQTFETSRPLPVIGGINADQFISQFSL